MIEFKHCKKDCSYNNHCGCVFECGTFMADMGDCSFMENPLGWSVQAWEDFYG